MRCRFDPRRTFLALVVLSGCSAAATAPGGLDASASATGGHSAATAERSAAGSGGSGVSAGAGGAGGMTMSSGGAQPGGSTSSGGAPADGGRPAPGDASTTTDGGSATPDGGDVDATIGGPSPQPTGYGDFTGVCAYSTQDFAALQAIGIKNARMDRPTAAVIETARTYGIEVLPIADYGFTDLSGQNDDKYPPLPQNYAEWAQRMVDNWRSMQDPPKVLEVWNEPWNASFWKPQPDPAAYLELVKAFAKEAWAVWPNATLLVSADEVYPQQKWRDPLLQADTTGFLSDPRVLPTTHNYVEARTPTQVTSEPCSYDLNRFDCAYTAFKAHGHPDPQVWITEFGWDSATAGGTDTVATVSEELQATYTTDALRSFRSSGHVAKAFSFLYHRDDPWNYNWLRPDNSQKPVCASVKTLIATGM